MIERKLPSVIVVAVAVVWRWYSTETLASPSSLPSRHHAAHYHNHASSGNSDCDARRSPMSAHQARSWPGTPACLSLLQVRFEVEMRPKKPWSTETRKWNLTYGIAEYLFIQIDKCNIVKIYRASEHPLAIYWQTAPVSMPTVANQFSLCYLLQSSQLGSICLAARFGWQPIGDQHGQRADHWGAAPTFGLVLYMRRLLDRWSCLARLQRMWRL